MYFFEAGEVTCVCCETLLFDSAEKFDSGTGWPSFTQPIKDNVIAYYKDRSHGMYELKRLATLVMHIWDMFFKMVPCLVDCDLC